jgi:MFS superfamily sulfate permease-like transporter
MWQTADAPTGLVRYWPILGWQSQYRPAWLRADLLAGLVAAAMVIP